MNKEFGKKLAMAFILCASLWFIQPSMKAYTTTTTTVHHTPSFLESLCETNPKLGVYVTLGVIAGGIVGFIAYVIGESERNQVRRW